MERLLYVALTRAKHTLVLAFDRQFFRNARGQFHRNSQISWLRAGDDECNCQVMAALSSEARECPETGLRQKSAPRERVSEHLGKRELGWVDDARRQGVRFVHTISPSKFAPEEETGFAERADVWIEIEPELRPPRIENPATRYGLWWHEFVQQLPIPDESSWEKIFAVNVTSSPDPARSKREWEMLKKHLASESDFRRRINATIVHSEMPFLWRMQQSKCLEGIVDLALFNGDKALIL